MTAAYDVETVAEVEALMRAWTGAQERGDVPALDALSIDGFLLVGPNGLVLEKEAWLDRHRSGALTTHRLDWDQVVVRDHGTAAVAVGRHSQTATHAGSSHDGTFRASHFILPGEDGWQVVAMHLCSISEAPVR